MEKKEHPNFSNSGFYRINLWDILLIGAILLLSAGAMAHIHQGPSDGGAKAEIHFDGKQIEKLLLKKDQRLDILDGRMAIEVREGRVRVAAADCPKQICVKAGWAKRPGEIITCAPNRVLIEITSQKTVELDAVIR